MPQWILWFKNICIFLLKSFVLTALGRLDPFEALAEIFDFAAGLVQRVPKKPNIVKADL